ncbi:efflux RND transporter periplasmic adaptor subunit [bacterium]|nr:efflux RND transporter periplasmic adaptor subunit [bacterium]
MSDWFSKVNQKHKVLIPIALLLIGIAAAFGFMATASKPEKVQKEHPGALVEIQQASMEEHQVMVRANGVVKPRFEVNLTPQVSGVVSWISPKLEAGGFFEEGEELLRIDQRDYELAVRQAEASVAQAEFQLETARANADIAKREWELVHSSRDKLLGESSGPSEPDPLVLHKPQLKQAEAVHASAKASLDRAKLNLERTILTAPFNARVRMRNVSVGQLVGPTGPVASLYSTDRVEVEVTVPSSDLYWLRIPGSKADVRLSAGDNVFVWEGRLDRNMGVVDEVGLARLVVQVSNPFHRPTPQSPELSVGSFVTVDMYGQTLDGVISLPRKALRRDESGGFEVWVMNGDNTLTMRDVSVVHMTPDKALIDEGVTTGENVILSALSGASPGMKLRVDATTQQGNDSGNTSETAASVNTSDDES